MMRLQIYFSQYHLHSVFGGKKIAFQHMHIAIINSEFWLGSSVSLNGPIHVNHSCLQASLGTH